MSSIPPAQEGRRRGRPPRSEGGPDLRVAAIDAARTLLTSGNELSMEGLARTLGVRAPSLYHHFPGGREEMILAIAKHYADLHGDALDAIARGTGDILSRLKGVTHYFAGPAAVHPYHMLTEERSRLSDPARSELRRLFSQRIEAPILRLVHEGQAAGGFRLIDPELSVRFFLTMLLRLGQIKAPDVQRKTLPDFVADLFIHGMENPKV